MEEKLIHKNCYIRPLKAEDVGDAYLKWIQDEEVTKYLEIRHNTYTKKDLLEYVASFENDSTKYLFGVFDNQTDKHVGNCTLYGINWNTETFDLGVLIGDTDYTDKNVGVEAVLLLFKYAFEHLKLRKFFGGCYSKHIQTIFVLKRCGCEKEAVLKDKFVHNGIYMDQLVFALTKEKWFSTVKPKFNL